MKTLFGVEYHGAEFVEGEDAAVEAAAGLAEDDRAAGGEPNQQRHQKKQRAQCDDGNA